MSNKLSFTLIRTSGRGTDQGAKAVCSRREQKRDEPFLKDLTTAFYDVKISPTQIRSANR